MYQATDFGRNTLKEGGRRFETPPIKAAARDRYRHEQIEAWLEAPNLMTLTESTDHWEVLKRGLRSGKIVGPRVHDARIATVCLQHGITELWSADRDFGRFPELETRNPLV